MRQALCAAALVLAPAVGWAEDTDIYFSSVPAQVSSGGDALANVLLILDVSGSMRARTRSGDTRIDALKDVVRNLLQNSQNLRVGLLVFNDRRGGHVRFPISFELASSVDGIPGEAGAAETVHYIEDGPHDVVQVDTQVYDAVTSARIGHYAPEAPLVRRAGVDQGTVGSEGWVNSATGIAAATGEADDAFVLDAMDSQAGFRFSAINIPAGETIDSAELTLFPAVAGAGDKNVQLNLLHSHPLTGDPADLARTATATASGSLASANPGDGAIDVTSLVQAAVNEASWEEGDAIFLRIRARDATGGAHRFFNHLAADPADRPRLEISWTPISTGAQQYTLGLHIDALDIPQGADIVGASLSLFSNSDNSNAASWQIYAEAADDAAPFDSALSSNVTSRTGTSRRTIWALPVMEQGQSYAVCAMGVCTGDSLEEVIEEVVGRSDWCGGNSLNLIIRTTGSGGSRDIAFSENGGRFAPNLRLRYTGVGCVRRSDVLQPGSGNDMGTVGYAPPRGPGYTPATGSSAIRLATERSGPDNRHALATLIRFPNVAVPKGATVTEARLGLAPLGRLRRARTFNIAALAADDVPALSRGSTQPSTLGLTSNGGTLMVGAGVVRRFFESSDLSDMLDELFERDDWESGNALALYITNDRDQARDSFGNLDYNRRYAPRITISYTGDGGVTGIVPTVRERLIETVQGLVAGGTTPIVPTLVEAARYWRGGEVYFGLNRLTNIGQPDTSVTNRISHPGSYCRFDDTRTVLSCPGAAINRPVTDEFGVRNPAGCTRENPDSLLCRGQAIQGSPLYQSPFRLPVVSCGGNHQILITDGNPTVGFQTGGLPDLRPLLTTLLGFGPGQCANLPGPTPFEPGINANSTHPLMQAGLCSEEIAEMLRTEDQDPDLPGTQVVTTHTIGFAVGTVGSLADRISQYYLGRVAEAGGGGFYDADTVDQLRDALLEVFASIRAGSFSTIASPSLSSNSFNRLRTRDKVYFGMFQPDKSVSWEGNVRQYNLCISSSCAMDGVQIGSPLDAQGKAVTNESGRFLPDSTSLWASSADGAEVTLGGAGEHDSSATAQIYTEARADGMLPAKDTALDTAGHSLTLANWARPEVAHIRQQICGTSTELTDDSDCGQVMRWLLGVDVGSSNTPKPDRWAFHDVLHSSPVSISYGGDRTMNTFVDRVLVGTNDGALRFINADSGETEWRFHPQPFLDHVRALFADSEQPHIYGLDLTPTVQLHDSNRNGVVDPSNDFVRVFMGMRRGGDMLYALDVTPSTVLTASGSVVPKFLWRIAPSSTGFARLGQTWSQPVVTRIATQNGPTDVLIFGGGYDDRLDETFQLSAGALGNAIYVVDPSDGTLLLGITGDCANCDGHIKVPDMDYSIPSRVSLLDSDGDGLDDRIYVGDTGGQVWRVDLDTGLVSGSAGDTVVGRLANISVAGADASQRKFFETPAVLQVLDSQYSDAAGGEYDYVLIGSGDRPNPLTIGVTDRFYAFRDRVIGALPDMNDDNLADMSYTTITESNMVDATSSALDGMNRTHRAAQGWYFTFPASDGEKVYSSPTVVAGTVLFTTYLPISRMSTSACAPNVGSGNAYNFDVLSTAAAIDWDQDGTLQHRKDHKKELGSGIPSDVLPLFTDQGVVGIVGVEGGAQVLGTLTALPRVRSYWYERSW